MTQIKYLIVCICYMDAEYIDLDELDNVTADYDYTENNYTENDLTNEENINLNLNGIKLYQYQHVPNKNYGKIVEVGIFNTYSDVMLNEFDYKILKFKLLSALFDEKQLKDHVEQYFKIPCLKLLAYKNDNLVGCFMYYLDIDKSKTINNLHKDNIYGVYKISFLNDDESVVLKTFPCNVDINFVLQQLIECVQIPYIYEKITNN